ncbi:hypothetical protein E5676_scaffold142G001850 [Cucumis melo var. makuwa]|uniref:Uncharacterized protein n=1 Tax=Cucumis melo var. makuwa TaxID=1194695 RepID=A0A5D3DIF5_CUCMM|nr:hypothetical protein E5676_scaffold142G001850 [Cucumis melo var. makuwa]
MPSGTIVSSPYKTIDEEKTKTIGSSTVELLEELTRKLSETSISEEHIGTSSKREVGNFGIRSLNTISYDSPKILPIKVYNNDMKNHYKRASPPDLGRDGLRPDFRSFDGNNIETWNIDGCSEGQMMIIFQEIWWHNHLTDANREVIKDAVLEKTEQDLNGDVVTIQPNSVNTVVYAAIKHFVGRTTLYSDQSMEALLGMKCPKMSDFKWYKDTFMSRLYNRTICRDVVWKHKYVEGLHKYVREKFYSTMVTNSRGTDIDWGGISYGDINSTIQKVCLEIRQQQKHATKIAKDLDYRREIGSFCKQYGIDNTPPSRKKSRSKKILGRSKTSESHGYSNRKSKYHGETEELSSEEEELSFEKEEDLLNALLEESSEEPSSSENETDNEEAIPCSSCINVLTSTQKGLLDIIEEVDDEAIRKKILLRLCEDLETPNQKFKDPMNFSFQVVKNLLSKVLLHRLRLKKNPKPWTTEHSRAVQSIKSLPKGIPCLSLLDEKAKMIVETDANSQLASSSRVSSSNGKHPISQTSALAPMCANNYAMDLSFQIVSRRRQGSSQRNVTIGSTSDPSTILLRPISVTSNRSSSRPQSYARTVKPAVFMPRPPVTGYQTKTTLEDVVIEPEFDGPFLLEICSQVYPHGFNFFRKILRKQDNSMSSF